MNALPFAMIRRNHNDSHDSQDAIQAAQSGQTLLARSYDRAIHETCAKQSISSCSNRATRNPSVSDQDGLSDFEIRGGTGSEHCESEPGQT